MGPLTEAIKEAAGASAKEVWFDKFIPNRIYNKMLDVIGSPRSYLIRNWG